MALRPANLSPPDAEDRLRPAIAAEVAAGPVASAVLVSSLGGLPEVAAEVWEDWLLERGL